GRGSGRRASGDAQELAETGPTPARVQTCPATGRARLGAEADRRHPLKQAELGPGGTGPAFRRHPRGRSADALRNAAPGRMLEQAAGGQIPKPAHESANLDGTKRTSARSVGLQRTRKGECPWTPTA